MRNRYSASEFIKCSYSLIMTKLFFKNARLVRRPIYIRGKKSLVGAKGLTTGYSCRFDLIGNKKTLFIGDNCEIGDMVHIVAYESVHIGNNVLMASKCFVSDTNHGIYNGINQSSPKIVPNNRQLITNSVRIGDNVWIGENVVVLAGADIGDGCVIGANSVIKKKIPANTIVFGNPAKVMKQWNEEKGQWIKL